MNSMVTVATQQYVATTTLQRQVAARFAQNGYFPIPLHGGTKTPIGIGWNVRERWDEVGFPDDGLVGVRCGDSGVFALDVDFDHDEIIALLRASFELFGSPCRIGKRGCVLLARWADGRGRAGHDLKYGADFPIQIKARGQVAAFGIHPDTGRPYRWVDDVGPGNTPLSALPTFQSMDELVALLDRIMAHFGHRRQGQLVERVYQPFLASAALEGATDAERLALRDWGLSLVAAAVKELEGMVAGTGRGTLAHELGLRVGALVGAGLLDGQVIADRIFLATGDDNASAHSFPRGVEASEGESIAKKLELMRRGQAAVDEAMARGLLPQGDFLSAPLRPFSEAAQGVEGDSLSEAGPRLLAALRDRAATLGGGRKSKTLMMQRTEFARLCSALEAAGALSTFDSYDLGVRAKEYGPEAGGQNPRQPTPADTEFAEKVILTAARGGDLLTALANRDVVLKPPKVEEGLTKIEGGLFPTDDKMFEVMSSRLASVNRDGSIFYVHRTLEGADERLSDRDLLKLYPNVFVGDVNGRELAISWWLKHPDFRVKRAVFRTSGEIGPEEYNFWRGFGVERTPGRFLIRRFARHLREVVCRRDKAKFKYLLRWMAWAVQNPHRNPEVVVVLKSAAEGSGKSTLSEVLRTIFGQHSAVISMPEQLLGKHNDHLEFASFVMIEEALFAGDPRQASAMRSKITSRTLTIEPKFVRAYQAPNIMHAIITTNHEWAIHAGHAARRWFVCEVSEERVGDKSYFDALHLDMELGGCGQLLDALLEVNLGGWHPRMVHRTEELGEQQRMSTDSVGQWLSLVAEEGAISYTSQAGTTTPLALGNWWRTSTLFSAYCASMRLTGGRPMHIRIFGKRLMSVLGAKRWSNHIRENELDREGRGFFVPAAEELETILAEG